jgi:hypothetical protein
LIQLQQPLEQRIFVSQLLFGLTTLLHLAAELGEGLGEFCRSLLD